MSAFDLCSLQIFCQGELDRIVRFGSLGAKTCSRLEHLQSEAYGLQDIHYKCIEPIEEQGNVGCGFVPQGFFKGIKGCKSANVFQIRIIGPRVGLIKGLLLVKQGIDRIQIPKSMIKAMPAKTEYGEKAPEVATVVFKNTAPSNPNKDLGKLLDPNAKPCDKYMGELQDKLSSMYQRILVGFGVSEELCNAYVQRARKVKTLRHATLMGVADPTGKISYGQVFIPGCE